MTFEKETLIHRELLMNDIWNCLLDLTLFLMMSVSHTMHQLIRLDGYWPSDPISEVLNLSVKTHLATALLLIIPKIDYKVGSGPSCYLNSVRLLQGDSVRLLQGGQIQSGSCREIETGRGTLEDNLKIVEKQDSDSSSCQNCCCPICSAVPVCTYNYLHAVIFCSPT